MNVGNIYRDKTLNDISENNVGETLRLAGWVENIRDHGGVSFVDLRDMYGVIEMKRHTIQRYLQEQSNLKHIR